MKVRRLIVSLLALCLLLSLAPLGSAVAADNGNRKLAPSASAGQKAGETITRAEWISGLVEAYHLSEQVDDNSLPDNYYPDLSEDASYYRDILVAVYFGMVDVEPGYSFQPEGPLTRDYAAFSLNLLAAFQQNTASYTFSDASSVPHPASAQVAVEQGWLSLVNGRFVPNQAVTEAEAEAMLQAAKTQYSATQVDLDHKNEIQFKSNVKEIPVGNAVSQAVDGSILFTNCPVTIQKGDTIAFYLGDIPSVYSVASVSISGQQTTVTGTPQTLSSAVLDVDMQGEFDVGLEYARPLDGSDLYYVMKSGEETRDQAVALAHSKDLSEIRGEKNFNLGGGVKLHVSFSMPTPTLKYNLKKNDCYVNLSDNATLTASVSGDIMKASGFPSSIPLVEYGIPGIGTVGVYSYLEMDGSVSLVINGELSVGLMYSDKTFSAPISFKPTSKTITAELNTDAGIKAQLNVNLLGADLIQGNAYVKYGGHTSLVVISRSDGPPFKCVGSDFYLYAVAGYDASVGKEHYSNSYYILDKNTLREVKHYEDGCQVPYCSVDKDFSKYFTSWRSRNYLNGGWSGWNGTAVDGNWEPIEVYTYKLADNGDAKITGFRGNVSALTIPSEIDGHKVAAIGEGAFKGLKQIYSVTFPDTLTIIESSAFFGCSNLGQVTLPDGLRKLSGLSFAHCTSLTSVYIPKTITNCTTDMYSSGFNVYEGGPFYKCSSLKSVRFAEGITSIPSNLFYGCNGLETIVIPETVTKVSDYAFHLCSRLSNVTLPSNLEELGPFSFGRCTSLRSISIPKTLKRTPLGGIAEGLNAYDGGPFYLCSNLASVDLATGMSYIPANLFYACTGLESVKIPDTVVEIRENAFRGCTALKSVDFPDSLTSIGATAFFGDESLTEIILPKNLKTLTGHAFTKCTNLESVFIPNSIETCTYEEYQSGLNFIKGGPFYNCSKLNKVEFEEGVTRILPNLFFGCNGLREIVIPETVTEIGGNAFNLSVSLRKITFPKNLETIAGHAFYKCRSLETVVVPDSVKSMGTYCFAFCDSLKSMTLPSTRVNIMAHMFEGCTALDDVVLPDSVTTIQESAFKDCSALSNLKWSNSVVEISSNAFENSGLQILDLPRTVNIIGKQAFMNCDNLTKAVIPDHVTSFGEKVFYDCDKLDSVHLGTGMTSIPVSSFENCDVLESIALPYGISSIGNNAFKDCVKLTEITILRNASSISDSAFSYPSILTIFGVSGSYAETYANQIGAKFVSISKPIKGIQLAKSEITLSKGNSYKLAVVFDPIDFTDAVDWKSSDTSIVTVNNVGIVKAVAGGTATISVVAGNLKATCTVTVLQPVTSISLNKTSLNLDAGSTYTLTATVNPSNANNKEIKWSSSDPSVATVTQDGVVTALKKGTATITCAAQDGSGVSRSCTVTVPNNVITVTDVKDLQSAHPYEVNCSDVWIYQNAGAGSLNVTFSQNTSVEAGSDYICIYDSNGNQIGKYTGTELAGQTVSVPGYLVKIKLVSDGSYCEYGFAVTEVKPIASEHTHTITAVAGVDATCTTDGTAAYWKCSICGMMFSDAQGKNVISAPAVIKATGHKWDSGKVTKEPTETTEGVKTFTCAVCGETRTESIPKLTDNPFTDVAENQYYYDPVLWAVKHDPQITNGTSATTFSPDADCTRGQIVTFLWRAKGCPEPQSTVNPFEDVKESDYFYKAVLWAVENGITNGMDTTHFGPNASCTRAQAVTFLWRAENKPAAKTQKSDFTDVQDASVYFYTPVLWAVENGITNGTSATTFSPDTTCTRGQIVTFLYRDLA